MDCPGHAAVHDGTGRGAQDVAGRCRKVNETL
jgi:hypothetical protein